MSERVIKSQGDEMFVGTMGGLLWCMTAIIAFESLSLTADATGVALAAVSGLAMLVGAVVAVAAIGRTVRVVESVYRGEWR